MKYRTRKNDTLDLICWNYYGYSEGAVESVLLANRDLARQGVVLDAGLIIELPDLTQVQTEELVRLWD